MRKQGGLVQKGQRDSKEELEPATHCGPPATRGHSRVHAWGRWKAPLLSCTGHSPRGQQPPSWPQTDADHLGRGRQGPCQDEGHRQGEEDPAGLTPARLPTPEPVFLPLSPPSASDGRQSHRITDRAEGISGLRDIDPAWPRRPLPCPLCPVGRTCTCSTEKGWPAV